MSNTLWPAPVQMLLGCKIPHELDAQKWNAIGRRRRHSVQAANLMLYFRLVSLKTNLVACPFLIVYVYLPGQCETSQLLLFAIVQRLVPEPGVFLRQMLCADVLIFLTESYYL
jgi:hypothetical protein